MNENASILYIELIVSYFYLTGNFKLAYIYCVSELMIRQI